MDDLKEDWFVRSKDAGKLIGWNWGKLHSIMDETGSDIVFTPRNDLKHFRRLSISASSREAIALTVELIN